MALTYVLKKQHPEMTEPDPTWTRTIPHGSAPFLTVYGLLET